MNAVLPRAMPIFWAALLAGVTYMVAVLGDWHGPLITAWKGAGVGLLALWASLNAHNKDGWLITAALALCALGDVLLDTMGLETGGAVFALGHVVAIWLYLRNRALVGARGLATLAIIPVAALIAWRLPGGGMGGIHAGLYTLFVAGMAATAWNTRFPRMMTGLGAMLFLASDLFIFSRYGLLKNSVIPDLAVWPLYFIGQAMIAWGVVTTLAKERYAG